MYLLCLSVRRLRQIMFSGCQSVPPLAHPFVRPSFSTHGRDRNGLSFDMYVSWTPSERIRFWPRTVIILILILFWPRETGQIWGFRPFSGERIGGMAWNQTCWRFLATFKTCKILVMTSNIGTIFVVIKWDIHWVYNYYLDNDWKEWPNHSIVLYALNDPDYVFESKGKS